VQWTRDGAPIAGAASRTYLVASADQGHRISAVVRVAVPGFETKDFPASNSIAVPAAIAQPPAVASAVKVKAKALGHKKVRLTLVVRAPGLTPTGTIAITRGAKKVGACTLVSGRCVVVLKRQKPGKATYSAAYAGTTGVASATARVKVRVR
jgi:hypothetical protein